MSSSTIESAENTILALSRALNSIGGPLDPARLENSIQQLGLSIVNTPHSGFQRTINAIVDNILDLDKAFVVARSSLSGLVDGTLTTEGLTADAKREIAILLDDWKRHHSEYAALLSTSRDVAEDAARTADDFANVFLTTHFSGEAEDIEIPEIKAAVSDAIAKFAGDNEESIKFSQYVLDLSQNIKNFEHKWTTLVKKYNLNYGNDEVGTLRNDIESINTTVASLNMGIVAIASAMGIIDTTTDALVIYGSLAPQGLFAQVLGPSSVGALVIKASSDGQVLLRELNKHKDMLHDHANKPVDDDVMTKLQASFATCGTLYKDIATKLNSFGRVWSSISLELQNIQNMLDTAMGDSDLRVFTARIQFNIALYNAIAVVSRIYRDTLDVKKLPPRGN